MLYHLGNQNSEYIRDDIQYMGHRNNFACKYKIQHHCVFYIRHLIRMDLGYTDQLLPDILDYINLNRR